MAEPFQAGSAMQKEAARVAQIELTEVMVYRLRIE